MVDIRVGQTKVPVVRGLDQTSAEQAIDDADLSFVYGTPQYSDEYAVDRIMSASPPETSDVDPGTVVTLVVSLGISPGAVGRFIPSITPRRTRRRSYF